MSTTSKDQEPADSSSFCPASASTQNATYVVRTPSGSMEDKVSGSIGIDGGDYFTEEYGGTVGVIIRYNLLTSEWFINDVSQGQMKRREE
jgi:hypothetical protein